MKIKTYWYIVPLAALLVVFVVANAVATCSGKKVEEVSIQTEISNARQHAIDSVNLVRNAEKIAAIDSALVGADFRLKNAEKEVEKSKRDVANSKRLINELERAYNEAKSIERCDTLLKAKDFVIRYQDSVISELDYEAIQYSQKIKLLSDKLLTKDNDISIYKERIITDSLNNDIYIKSLKKELKATKFQKFLYKCGAVVGISFAIVKSI